jgi:hypothetical protein
MNQLLTNNKVDRDSTQNVDFHSRRITNAGDAVNTQDYTTLNDLNNAIAALKAQLVALGIKVTS